jgi:hypothetical protein
MSTVFAKLGFRDFLRTRVCSVSPDAADGLDIPRDEASVSPSEERFVWYFVRISIDLSDK